MTAARDFSKHSWRLKLARAEKHMEELEVAFGRYASRHPYEARRVHESDTDERRWRWALHITEQPDHALAIIIGDVLTNFRASLDHLAGALAPKRRKAWFPIVADIGKHNPERTPEKLAEYEKGRKSFKKAVEGMPDAAVTIIEAIQPYNVPPFDWETPQIHPLLTLNRLVQEDKHRNLVPIVTGLVHVRSYVIVNTKLDSPGWYQDFCDEGARVADLGFPTGPIPSPPKVKVHVSGTPRITVNVVEGYGNNDLMQLMRDTLRELGSDLFPSLEAHIPEP